MKAKHPQDDPPTTPPDPGVFERCFLRLGKPHLILKDEQRRSMQAVFDGRDVFVCLPTGFGKSLCYQALPFIFDRKCDSSGAVNCVIVFSPLVALMVDQVECLVCTAVVISSGSRDTIAKEFLAIRSEADLSSATIWFLHLKQMCGEKESFLHTGTSSRLVILSAHFCLLEIWLNRHV